MATLALSAFSRRGQTTITYVTMMTLLFYLFVADLMLFQTVNGQAYHFSKGWMPGRKRTSTLPASAAAAAGHDDSSEATSGLHHIDSAAALVDAVRKAMYGSGGGGGGRGSSRVGDVDDIRSEANSPSTAAAAEAICLMRSHVYRLLLEIVRDGFKTFDETCENQRGLPDGSGGSWDDVINYLRRRQSTPVAVVQKSTSND